MKCQTLFPRGKKKELCLLGKTRTCFKMLSNEGFAQCLKHWLSNSRVKLNNNWEGVQGEDDVRWCTPCVLTDRVQFPGWHCVFKEELLEGVKNLGVYVGWVMSVNKGEG